MPEPAPSRPKLRQRDKTVSNLYQSLDDLRNPPKTPQRRPGLTNSISEMNIMRKVFPNPPSPKQFASEIDDSPLTMESVQDVSHKLLDATFGKKNIRSSKITPKQNYGLVSDDTTDLGADVKETLFSLTLPTEEFPLLGPSFQYHLVESATNSIHSADSGYRPTDAARRNYYDDFTSIDWVYGNERLSNTKHQLNLVHGLRGKIKRLRALVENWVVLGLVAVVFTAIAYAINVWEFFLVDLRRGYCRTNWLTNEQFCDAWTPWLSLFPHLSIKELIELAIYICSSAVFALVAVYLTLTTKNENPLTGRTIYSAAGSGVPEVKTIISGFIIRKFLGVYTLFTKSAGLIFVIASGLTVGKEGPFVHLATCVGNLCSRAFESTNANELVRRQIMSAASGVGFALSFGSPLGGVLFSIEEITYYDTGSQLFKSFFCAILGILVMKFLNPYGTGKPVLFETSYTSEWKPFELIYFIIIGAVGGLHGALFCKFLLTWWPQFFRQNSLFKDKYVREVLVIALLTLSVTFFNHYTRQPIPELLLNMASPCTVDDTNVALCPRLPEEYVSSILTVGAAFCIKLVLTAMTYGLKVPSGIYVPSMVLGATFGRTFSMCIQYIHLRFPSIEQYTGLTANDGVDYGIYAMIGAGAFMAGITRMNVTLATTLFELTESYTYVLPISIAVAVSNWVANSIEPLLLYELLIRQHDFPFIKNTKTTGFGDYDTVRDLVDQDVVMCDCRVELNDSGSTTMAELRSHLRVLQSEKGMFDGCLPVLQNGVLKGIIPGPDLEFGLDKLREFCFEHSIRKDVVVKIASCEDEPSLPALDMRSIASSRQLLATEVFNELTDFSGITDTSPLQIDISAKTALVELLFKRVGSRAVCVLEGGRFVGVLHKKLFIKYLRQYN